MNKIIELETTEVAFTQIAIFNEIDKKITDLKKIENKLLKKLSDEINILMKIMLKLDICNQDYVDNKIDEIIEIIKERNNKEEKKIMDRLEKFAV